MCRCEAGWNEVERPGGGCGWRSEGGDVERKARDGTDAAGWHTEYVGREADRNRKGGEGA